MENPTVKRIPSAFALLKESFEIYKSNLSTFVSIVAIASLIQLLLANIIIYVSGNAAIIISSILSYLFNIMLPLAILYAIKDISSESLVLRSYHKSLYRLFPFIWLNLLLNFILIAGVALFIIPAIIFSFWFILSFAIFTNENIGGMTALLKSREYVRGQFSNVIGKIVTILIIAFFSSFLSKIFAELFKEIFSINEIISELIGQFLIAAIFAPIMAIFTFILYLKIKELKGEDFTFEPSRKQKVILSLLAVLGIAALIVIIALVTQIKVTS